MPLGSFRIAGGIAKYLPPAIELRNRQVLTAFGNTRTSTNQSKFGGSSLYFNGTTNTYLRISNSNDFKFGTNDFTIEFWINRQGGIGGQGLIDFRTAFESQTNPSIRYIGSLVYIMAGGAPIVGSDINNNQWYHVALCRHNNSTRLFLNGTQTGNTYTDNNNIQTPSNIIIGSDFDGSSPFQGWIDEIRFSNNARYTSNFTPPSEAFVNDQNTKLLIHGDNIIIDDNGEIVTQPEYFTIATTNTQSYLNWERTGSTFANFAMPSNGNEVFGIDYTSDSLYFAVVNGNQPSTRVYKKTTNNSYIQLTSFSTAGDGGAIAWSKNDEYLAFGSASSPFLYMQKRTGDTFSALTIASPAGYVRGLSFSPDNTYLAVSSQSSPFLEIYKRSGDTFTKLSSPLNVNPTGSSRKVQFSPDGVYLAIAINTSPFVHIYKKNSNDTWTKLDNPATLPTGAGNAVGWDPTTTYLAVMSNTTPFLFIYKRSGDTFTKLNNPSVLPPGSSGFPGTGVAFTADSNYLAVGSQTSPYLRIYSRNGDTFTSITLPTPSISGRVNDLTFFKRAKFNEGQ